MELAQLKRKFSMLPSEYTLYSKKNEELKEILERARELRIITRTLEITFERNDFLFDLNVYMGTIENILDKRRNSKAVDIWS